MKKFNLLFVMAAILGLGFMSSCDTTITDVDPLLTIATTGLGAGNTILEGNTFTISVTAAENPESKSKLEDLVIVKPGADTTIVINASSYAETFTYNAPAAGQVAEYTFTLTDKDNVTVSQTVTVTGEANVVATPLGAATAFTMVRCGSNNDPVAHGLQFDAVTGASPNFTAVVIKVAAADKLVELSAAEWSSITTVEDLEAAVAAGTGIAQITMTLGGAVNSVVATQEGSVYKLINFTNASSPAPCSGGSEVTLTGEYKM